MTLPCLTPTMAQANSNITLGTVTTTLQSASLFRRSALARVLASLLLVFILYGTTIEAAHRHGRVLRKEASQLSLSVSQPDPLTRTASGQPGCSECLICQLQKSFSAPLISVRAVSARPSSRLNLQVPSAIALKSQTTTPQKGRAPPFTS